MTGFKAVITDIRLESRDANGRARWQMTLDPTRFTEAEPTGVLEATAPSGTRLIVPVLGVQIGADGEVWHIVDKPLAAGTDVLGRVGQTS